MPPNEDAEVLVQMAGDLIRQGQFDKAEPILLQAVEIDPLFGAARSSLALVYNIMGNYDDAIEQLTQALKKRHKDDRQPDEIYKLSLANSYRQKKEFKKMAKTINEVIKSKPSMHEDIYVIAGDAYDGLKDFKNMAAVSNKGLKVFPYSARTMANLAIAYHNLGEVDKAIATLDDASTMYPDKSQELIFIGFAYCRLGKTEKGLELINKAIEMEPRNVIFQTFLAKAYQLSGDLNKAISIIDKAIEISPLDGVLKEYKQELESLK